MLRSIASSIEFEKFRRNWSENELNETLFTKAFQVASHFNYEICELRRRPIGSSLH
ncbi:hypothetical protein [Leptospira noguchii]|uniref:hypothetical protein n=1 Tax=Leptospira noguchii TaxID=28182 RepID=UPI0002D3790D|nr:hypothetical protein [Leptospira noguchii]